MRALLLLAVFAAACAGDPLPLTNCTAGVQTACACPGGSTGAQRCAADGSGFGACMCEGVDAAVGDAGADAVAVADGGRDAPDALGLDAAVGDAVAVGDVGIPRDACPRGDSSCGADYEQDPRNCGGCGHVCPASAPMCHDGLCVAPVCPSTCTRDSECDGCAWLAGHPERAGFCAGPGCYSTGRPRRCLM